MWGPDALDRIGKVELTVAVVALAFGVLALVLAETAFAEVLLAVFMGAILVVWAIELMDHLGIVPGRPTTRPAQCTRERLNRYTARRAARPAGHLVSLSLGVSHLGSERDAGGYRTSSRCTGLSRRTTRCHAWFRRLPNRVQRQVAHSWMHAVRPGGYLGPG